MDNLPGGRRGEIIEFFRASERPLSAREIAGELGLHLNTVRFHLDALIRHGLVRREEGRSDGPGRPSAQYVLTPGMNRSGPRNYQLLSEMLLSHLAGQDDPAAAAQSAGEAWGRYLVQPPAPGQRLATTDGLLRLTDLLSDVGFAPELSTGPAAETEIRLRHCPFLEMAETHRDLVCGLHLGLMRGALQELGTGLRTESLIPFVDPQSCLARLVPADADRNGP